MPSNKPAQNEASWASLLTAPEPHQEPANPWANLLTPDASPEGRHTASGVLESAQAGWEGSATGLAIRRKLPDVVLDPHHAQWYEKLAAGTAQTLAELPEMAVGFAAGSAVGGPVIGGGAGTFGVPTLLRESLMQAYESGEAQSSGDFLSRAGIVIKQTAKDALVGALTFGAGKVAQTAAKAFGPVAAETANLTAQTGTMVVAPAALEGRLPEPVDFMNAAIMVAGGKAAVATAGKIRNIYARTGVEPLQVVSDAAKDPVIAEELKAPGDDIPRAYQPLAAEQTARDAVPGTKAEAVKESPFAVLPDQTHGPAPTEVNYKYINSTDDAKAAMQRLSEVYEADIQAQRRGTVAWSKTIADANALLKQTAGGKDPALLMKREPGTPAGDAELLARKQLMVGAAEEMSRSAREYEAKVSAGTVSPNDTVEFLASIERASVIQSEFLGARAETGRALNALKITQDVASRAKVVQDVLDQYGKDPAKLASMLKALDTPEGALKFAREVTKATTWEKIVEAWKAGLVSGPVTHAANVIGNTTLAMLRTPVDVLAAGIHTLRHGPDAARLSEPVARVFGLMQGTLDGLKVAAGVMKTGEYGPSKSEQYRPAIEGKTGEVVRLPFRALAAEDALFRSMNERAQTYSEAFQLAAAEGHGPLTREFRERVAELVEHPTPEMQEAITKAGDRFTFNTPLGEKGRAIQHLVRSWHLEWAVPFVRTPANIAKELGRLTPLAPFVAEWRADMAKGGIAGEKAVAEIVLGSAMAGVVTGLALDGKVSGAGNPDPSKRRIDLAAGWQPYSLKIGDQWYSYARIQPIGTLFGIAADMAEVWQHFTDAEREHIPKMIGIAFSNAITHQTFLQGFANIVNAISDWERYGAQGVHSMVGSLVPGIVAQPAQMMDPLVREVHTSLDAVKSRVPIWRESLLARRDPFGEPTPNKERVGLILPSTATDISKDMVRLEASRLGVGVAKTPDSVSLPAAHDRKLGKVELTPEQQDVFANVSGHLAYQVLSPIVNGPAWGALPDMVKKRIYEVAFEKARKRGAVEALPLDQRHEEIQRITDEIARRLAQ